MRNSEKALKGAVFFILIMVLFSNYTIKYNKSFLGINKNSCLASSNKEDNEAEFNVDFSYENIKGNKKLIVIDPGHGGKDKGTNLGDLYEKNITLQIAKHTERYLHQKGYKVVMTREEDKFVSLKNIGRLVNKVQPEIFVSIHVNSFKEEKYKGFSTHYYDPMGYQRNKRIDLAKVIQNTVSKSGMWEDRGIFKQNIAVLRYSKYPCVLVECGFITNQKDRDKLQNKDALRITGESIAKGIIEYSSKND